MAKASPFFAVAKNSFEEIAAHKGFPYGG